MLLAAEQAPEPTAVASGSPLPVQSFSSAAAVWPAAELEGAEMRIRMLLVVAGLLAVPGLALAQDTGSDSQEYGQDSMGTMGSEATGGSGGSGGSGVSQGSEVRTGMQTGSQQSSQQVQIFKSNKRANFELKGTVSSVDPTANTITVNRQGLPPVELQVAQGTDIKYSGRQASLNELQPGSEVRARFNVAENQPLAIELDAKPSKGMKEMNKGSSSGSSGSMGGSSSGSSSGSMNE